jgi:hypothetical protein
MDIAEARAALTAAEAELERLERPGWDREHARFDLATARNAALTVPPHLKAAADAAIPAFEDRHAATVAAHEAHVAAGVTDAQIDAAAQAVVDLRARIAELEAGQ